MQLVLAPGIKAIVQYCLIFFGCFAVYFAALNYGFIWDDYTYIVNNEILRQPEGILRIWTSHVTADFWPLSYSLFWLQTQLFANDTFWFHFVNLFLFAVSGVLLFCLLKKLELKSAFLLAFIYVVHPMNVEAAVWVFQAKTNLANVLGLSCFIFWINFVGGKNQKLSYALTFVFLILSFLAKISLVMLPFLMLLYSYYFNRDEKFVKKIAKTGPFFLAALLIGLVNVFWDANAFQVPASEMILEPDYLFRFALVGKTFLFYLTKSFWPWPLMFAHPRWNLDLNNFETFIPSVVLSLFLCFAIYKILKRQKMNLIMAGFLVSFLILLPALGLAEIYFMRFSFVAEHWLTLGLIGFIAGIFEILYAKRYLNIGLWLVIPCFAGITFNYTQDYSSEKTLLESSLEKNPVSILPHNILGLIYKNEKNLEKAMEHFQKSIDIQPNAQSYFNRASIFESFNQIELAKINYLKAVELNPYIPKAYTNLGALHGRMNDYATSLAYFQKSLEIDPTDSNTYYNIGYIYELMNQKEVALEWFKKADILRPGNEIYLDAIRRLRK